MKKNERENVSSKHIFYGIFDVVHKCAVKFFENWTDCEYNILRSRETRSYKKYYLIKLLSKRFFFFRISHVSENICSRAIPSNFLRERKIVSTKSKKKKPCKKCMSLLAALHASKAHSNWGERLLYIFLWNNFYRITSTDFLVNRHLEKCTHSNSTYVHLTQFRIFFKFRCYKILRLNRAKSTSPANEISTREVNPCNNLEKYSDGQFEATQLLCLHEPRRRRSCEKLRQIIVKPR